MFLMPGAKKVLFVCVENAGRSQMAEGFFRKYAPSGYEPQSAGTKPIGAINPLAITVMKEIGIDISNQQPKMISDPMIHQSYRIVNMGCMDKESCPAIFVQNTLDWEIPDPKGKPLDDVRKIRDLIEKRTSDLCKTLE